MASTRKARTLPTTEVSKSRTSPTINGSGTISPNRGYRASTIRRSRCSGYRLPRPGAPYSEAVSNHIIH